MLSGLTPERLRDACDELYRPDGFRSAPAQIFLDQFAAADPPTTFLRVSFPGRFTDRSARQLSALAALLQGDDASGNVVFVIYFDRLSAMELARHSIQVADR
jgi:hypothetical protein